METKSKFTTKVVRELLHYDFSVLLYNTEKLEDNTGGYCWIDDDDNKREFAVAIKHHMGFEILIHEYCHFLQWKLDRKLWNNSIQYYDVLFDWIEDKNLHVTEDNLSSSLNCIIRLEHDCESRVLKLIQHNPIEDFDRDKYIRAANAYLLSYHLNKELRKRPARPIYTEKILAGMSNTFNSIDFYLNKNNLTPDIKKCLLAEYE